MLFSIATLALAATGASAQGRPSNTSICDYYTSALLMNNTAENQYTLLKLIVNTVALGNYTTNPAPKNAVPGILAPGTVNGTAVNLAPFFTGMSGPTTNRNGVATAGVNFLDGGGATPLLNNTLPTEGSNQYKLVTHLYQYFGYLLGCSMQGNDAFPAYQGNPSQYAVHKYMYLTTAQNTYFIQQVALAASSFGVAQSDIAVVGSALNSLFNVRCGPNVSVPMSAAAAPQSICITPDCALAANASCAAYASNSTSATQGPNSTVVNRGNSTGTSGGAAASGSARASGSAAGGASASASGSTVRTSSAANLLGLSAPILVGAAGLIAFAL
ncbi:hypothetical protein PYCC9005_005789 [Savitreella phatthalungensis]